MNRKTRGLRLLLLGMAAVTLAHCAIYGQTTTEYAIQLAFTVVFGILSLWNWAATDKLDWEERLFSPANAVADGVLAVSRWLTAGQQPAVTGGSLVVAVVLAAVVFPFGPSARIAVAPDGMPSVADFASYDGSILRPTYSDPVAPRFHCDGFTIDGWSLSRSLRPIARLVELYPEGALAKNRECLTVTLSVPDKPQRDQLPPILPRFPWTPLSEIESP